MKIDSRDLEVRTVVVNCKDVRCMRGWVWRKQSKYIFCYFKVNNL